MTFPLYSALLLVTGKYFLRVKGSSCGLFFSAMETFLWYLLCIILDDNGNNFLSHMINYVATITFLSNMATCPHVFRVG